MRPVWMLLGLRQAPSLDGSDNQPLRARISRVIRVTSVNPIAKRVAAYSAFGIVAALTIMITSCGPHSSTCFATLVRRRRVSVGSSRSPRTASR